MKRTYIKHSIIEELQRQFPDGYMALSRYAIVGDLGMKIHWLNPDGTRGSMSFKKDERLYIQEICGQFLKVTVGMPRGAIVHHSVFKGISKDNRS